MMIELVPLSRLDGKEASDLTWRLLQERPPEANISHVDMPTRQEHDKFVLLFPYEAWYAIASERGVNVGTILLTKHNEIGIAILKDHQRRGYAKKAIEVLMRIHVPAPSIPGQRSSGFLANVAPTNAASIALFDHFGKGIQWTYRL